MKEIVLCCGGRRCPVVTCDGDNITITDDYNGSVQLTRDQLRMLAYNTNILLADE